MILKATAGSARRTSSLSLDKLKAEGTISEEEYRKIRAKLI